MIHVGASSIWKEVEATLEADVYNRRWSQTTAFGFMAVEVEVGEFLYAFVRATKPLTVVETGTHKGFSALMIAYALAANREGHLYTIDHRDYGVQQKCATLGLSDRMTFLQADSIDALCRLRASLTSIDFLWLDSDHSISTVLQEFDTAFPLLRPGSYIAFHDSLSCPSEPMAIKEIRREYPHWEYIRLLSARGLDLMRVTP